MMQPESLVELADEGNFAGVEEEWMKLIELPDLAPKTFASFSSVLARLKKTHRQDLADTLAWAAVESLSGRADPPEVLRVAGPFLLALGDSEDMRTQVTSLYQTVYADRDTLPALIEEAGIAGGRPVRRALRTLDVCLAVASGDYLISRDDDEPARIDGIDLADWHFSIKTPRRSETLGPVELADRYAPATADDLRVMRHFAPDQFSKCIADDPGSVVIAVCNNQGGKITRDGLMAHLVPGIMPEDDWKKWWTRARTALKKIPSVQIERRAPYTITISDEEISREDAFKAQFVKLHDPTKQFEAIERYLSDCKLQGESPSQKVLRQAYATFRTKADRAAGLDVPTLGFARVAARRLGEVADVDDAADPARALFAKTDETAALLTALPTDALEALALDTLIEARPDDWQDRMLEALPNVPMSVCEKAAAHLAKAGKDEADFEPIVDRIICMPVRCFEALLWLWDGSAERDCLPEQSLVTLLSRILRGLDDARRDAKLDKAAIRRMCARSRAVLAARSYERFRASVEEMEAGVANTIRRQISRQDGFGRAVREDLLKHLSRRFPVIESKAKQAPWERDDVIYVTHAGLVRKQNEIEHHVNVKMKQNAIAIGNAAERGDLSENSEYKFALEERDLLRARLAQMNSEVAVAQVVSEDDVPTNHIGVGTRAVFRRVTDNERYELSFVGPWEADMASGRLNYKTPIAQKVLGSRVGDKVEFEHTGANGEYEVAELYNALAEHMDLSGPTSEPEA